jgi:hypothetical protein
MLDQAPLPLPAGLRTFDYVANAPQLFFNQVDPAYYPTIYRTANAATGATGAAPTGATGINDGSEPQAHGYVNQDGREGVPRRK